MPRRMAFSDHLPSAMSSAVVAVSSSGVVTAPAISATTVGGAIVSSPSLSMSLIRSSRLATFLRGTTTHVCQGM